MRYFLIIHLLLVISCTNIIHNQNTIFQFQHQQVARSNKGVVTTAHPLATNAGIEILKAGGNAMDAAVAAAFTLSVVEPSMSGIGGRAQILIYNPYPPLEVEIISMTRPV